MTNKNLKITVKEIVCRNIQEGTEISLIIKRVKNKLPHSKVNAGQIKFYVNYLFIKGIIDIEQKRQYVGKVGRPSVVEKKIKKIKKKPGRPEVVIKKIKKKVTISDRLKPTG